MTKKEEKPKFSPEVCEPVKGVNSSGEIDFPKILVWFVLIISVAMIVFIPMIISDYTPMEYFLYILVVVIIAGTVYFSRKYIITVSLKITSHTRKSG